MNRDDIPWYKEHFSERLSYCMDAEPALLRQAVHIARDHVAGRCPLDALQSAVEFAIEHVPQTEGNCRLFWELKALRLICEIGTPGVYVNGSAKRAAHNRLKGVFSRLEKLPQRVLDKPDK